MARLKSTEQGYGKLAVALHWVSAVLILTMIPLGFLMQGASGAAKLKGYQIHAVMGCLILLLTLIRVIWKWMDVHPNPLPELTGIHLKGTTAIHRLLYATLFLMTISGMVLIFQSGMVDLLRGATQTYPDLEGYGARRAHGLLARLYIGLLIAHIGGVVLHQIRHGNALPRMGLGKPKTHFK